MVNIYKEQMYRKDYEREAELLAELASLAMKEEDYGKAEKYLQVAQSAIATAWKKLQWNSRYDSLQPFKHSKSCLTVILIDMSLYL